MEDNYALYKKGSKYIVMLIFTFVAFYFTIMFL